MDWLVWVVAILLGFFFLIGILLVFQLSLLGGTIEELKRSGLSDEEIEKAVLEGVAQAQSMTHTFF